MISSLMDRSGHEIRLDLVGAEAFQVLEVERRPGVHEHPGPCGLNLRIVVEMRSLDVVRHEHRHDVPLRGAGGDGDVFRLGIEFRQHVPRVVIEPFRLRFRRVRRKRNRPADLQDHLRHRLLQPAEQIIVLVEIDRALAGRGIAHVHVQHRRAGVVAVDRRLHLLVPGERNVGIARQPLRPVGGGRDDERRHVLRKN